MRKEMMSMCKLKHELESRLLCYEQEIDICHMVR